jgi:hypothetical protein
VPLLGSRDDFGKGWSGEMDSEIIKPSRTRNGNARMQRARRRLRVLVVMLAAELAKNLAASIIQVLPEARI